MLRGVFQYTGQKKHMACVCVSAVCQLPGSFSLYLHFKKEIQTDDNTDRLVKRIREFDY